LDASNLKVIHTCFGGWSAAHLVEGVLGVLSGSAGSLGGRSENADADVDAEESEMQSGPDVTSAPPGIMDLEVDDVGVDADTNKYCTISIYSVVTHHGGAYQNRNVVDVTGHRGPYRKHI
jgi:hypothetical protein